MRQWWRRYVKQNSGAPPVFVEFGDYEHGDQTGTANAASRLVITSEVHCAVGEARRHEEGGLCKGEARA
jgi:hypothetical protein